MSADARTVLITGAARRIGATVARALAADGWKVLIHYNKSGAHAEELAAEIARSGGLCEIIRADLSCRADIDQLISTCVELHGPLTCLMNNAASFINDTIQSVTWESFESQITTNVAAPLFLAREFARLFQGQENGCIINMLDQKVLNLNPDFLSYTLSKVALHGLTQVLAMAFGGRIRVCGIAPGVTLISGKQTPASFEKAWRATPTGRSSTPQEIAACVKFILATPSLNGQTIVLDGGESIRRRPRDVAFDLEDESI